jgi:hypothetical protein
VSFRFPGPGLVRSSERRGLVESSFAIVMGLFSWSSSAVPERHGIQER